MEKKMERRGLGRGLSALMADVRLDQGAATADGGAAPDRLIATERLIANPNQPRRTFEPTALKDLADSLRQKGVIQPLIVRPTANPEQYEIVAGERRWRAAQMAQIHQVPVIIRDFDDAEVLEIAIIENVQRAELNAIEEAQAYRQLMDRFGHTQEKIAEALSKSRSHIANVLRLLALPDDVQSMVEAGKLSPGHARALITTPNATELALQVVGRGLTVRQTEALVRKSAVPAATRSRLAGMRDKDADTRALEGDLAAALRMGVSINHEPGGERGKLTITYNTLDDLDMLCRVLSQASRDVIG